MNFEKPRTSPQEELNKTPEKKVHEMVNPDLESDPTLTFFSRINNPTIQNQIVGLLLRNGDFKEAALVDENVYLKDEKGMTVFDENGAGVIERKIMKPAFPGYIKKTRGQIEQDLKERIQSVTQLGGEKNVVYLHKRDDPANILVHYDSDNDEVISNNRDPLTGVEGNPRPAQVAATLAHEKGHQLRMYANKEVFIKNLFGALIDKKALKFTPEEAEADKAAHPENWEDLDFAHPETSLRWYLDGEEILERMSQIKNYFGFKGDEIFTKEHLEYAKAHYIDDMGFDNNMGPFLRAITPEKEAQFIEGMNTLGV